MEKLVMSAAGVAAGMVLAGTIGVLVTRSSPRKEKKKQLARGAARAMNTVEDAMHRAARTVHKYC